MGQKNSSLTRVMPLFDFIGNDILKLNKLISMIQSDIQPITNLKEKIKYGKNEKGLQPPKSHLLWQIDNFSLLKVPNDFGSKEGNETYNLRMKLYEGDIETIINAKNSILNNKITPKSAWFIFEGYTYPDIYFETDKAIFIGEAKRTEKNITTKTTWMQERDQLIRHIDSVLDSPKQIFSFYILEKKEFDKGKYEKSMELYRYKDYFKRNLKHRNNEKEIKKAFESFIGYLFWEDIAKEFCITFPDEICD